MKGHVMTSRISLLLLVLGAGLLMWAENAPAKNAASNQAGNGAADCGKASWYDLDSQTASGEWMDASQFTAAHRDMRFGTMVKVTNRANGRSVVVRVNDRGPFIEGRIIDVSRAAAGKLGMLQAGHVPVCIQALS